VIVVVSFFGSHDRKECEVSFVSVNGTQETGAKIESRPILKKPSSFVGSRGGLTNPGNENVSCLFSRQKRTDSRRGGRFVGVVVGDVVPNIGDLSTKR
jgi:hypothetical protein